MTFNIIFMIQNYVLYRRARDKDPMENEGTENEKNKAMFEAKH